MSVVMAMRAVVIRQLTLVIYSCYFASAGPISTVFVSKWLFCLYMWLMRKDELKYQREGIFIFLLASDEYSIAPAQWTGTAPSRSIGCQTKASHAQ